MTTPTTLRDISAELMTLLDAVSQAEGELTPEQEARLDHLNDMLVSKTDRVADYLQHLDGTAADIAAELQRLTDRRKRVLAQTERLERYVMQCLTMQGRTSVKGTLHTLAIRQNPASLVIDDLAALQTFHDSDADMTRQIMAHKIVETWTPNKAVIKDRLKTGDEIPGVRLESSQRLHRD